MDALCLREEGDEADDQEEERAEDPAGVRDGDRCREEAGTDEVAEDV